MPPGTVIRSFTAPSTVPRGLTWDGRALWHCDSTPDLIYQIDPVTGTVIRSFAAPGAVALDLAWDGRTLWHCDNDSDLIFQIDPETGTVIRSFATPAANPAGITWDGRSIWLSDNGAQLIYQIDPTTGTVMRSFATPATTARGLAWDGHSLWHCDQTTDRVYQIDTATGTVIRSFPAPGINPQGLTWDGRTLWVTDTTSDLIYQLSVTPGASYADRVLATGPIGYWDQGEAAGTISFDISGNSPLSERDGAYTGVTLAQPGIGDGRTSGLYDGANDFDNIYTVDFRDAFNGAEGSILCWGRVSAAGVWTDGTNRRLMWLQADANNRVYIWKDAINNQVSWVYVAGGVTETHSAASTSVIWFSMGITWSAAADEVRYYLDGAPLATDTVLGVWAGALAATVTLIGAQSTAPLLVWDGTAAHGAVWARPLSPAEMLSLGVL